MYTDIPQHDEMQQLAAARHPLSVTLVLRTSPVSQAAEQHRAAFAAQIHEAAEQLQAQGADKHAIGQLRAGLEAIHEDSHFWRFLADSLVVFATPDRVRSYRLPNELSSEVFVGDRFRIVPLLRTSSFPQTAYVLALSQNRVRLIDVSPDHAAAPVELPELPEGIADALGVADPATDAPRQRLHGPEGHTARLTQYARAVDRAIAPVVRSNDRPLILAAAQPMQGVFAAICTSPQLLPSHIEGNPDERSEAELDAAARVILDERYRAEVAGLGERFENLRSAGRAITDLSDLGRAAVAGAIEQLIVGIDAHPAGSLDETSGQLGAAAPGRSLVDELAGATLAAGGRVLVLREGDVPGGGEIAATVRFSV